MDHRYDQSVGVKVHGDTQVDVVMDDQLVPADRGVEVRKRLQRLEGGDGDERQVREAEALILLERGLPASTRDVDTFIVDLPRHRRARGGGLRSDQKSAVMRRIFMKGTNHHPDPAVPWRRFAQDRQLGVTARDASTRAGAGHRRLVKPVAAQQTADYGGQRGQGRRRRSFGAVLRRGEHMRRRVMRPSGPVPFTLDASRPCSSSRRRTTSGRASCHRGRFVTL